MSDPVIDRLKAEGKLKEKTLFGVVDKVADSIRILREFEPEDEPYWVGFSGGKDSIVLKKIVEMSGVKAEFIYNVTTIDPPELIYYIREHHPDVKWDRPYQAFLTKLKTKGFPLRQRRWCCELYKERSGAGRTVVLGVRKSESPNRSKRKLFEVCFKDPSKRYVNPLLYWNDSDIWDFINKQNLPYCSLYDEGFERLGCLFCPYAKQSAREREYNKYPIYRKQFIKAFEELYKNRKAEGKKSVDRWESGEDMFNWWLFGENK